MQLEIVSTGMIQTIKISPWPCPLREPGVGVPTLLYMLHATCYMLHATDNTPLTEPRKSGNYCMLQSLMFHISQVNGSFSEYISTIQINMNLSKTKIFLS